MVECLINLDLNGFKRFLTFYRGRLQLESTGWLYLIDIAVILYLNLINTVLRITLFLYACCRTPRICFSCLM
jgi:hypothetical protein